MCLNAGTCHEESSVYCYCPDDWADEVCDIAVPKECEPDTCMHGGTCPYENMYDYVWCVCQRDRNEQFCEKEIPVSCEPDPCLNGGTCYDVDDGDGDGDGDSSHVFCHCPAGTWGYLCEKESATSCSSGICQNGGTCEREAHSYCECPLGWTGWLCEEPEGEPAPVPCGTKVLQWRRLLGRGRRQLLHLSYWLYGRTVWNGWAISLW